MVRIIFSTVLALHGIIHLMGFAKEWNLGPGGRFSGKTLFLLSENSAKLAGILWFLTCTLFLTSTASYYLAKDWFWIPAGAGIILSQALIIFYWQDARWGTIANVIILIAVIISAASFYFKKTSKAEVRYLIASSSKDQHIVTEEILSEQPAVIQSWLRKADIIGKEKSNFIHIIQKGSMRTDANSDWMPFDAEQYFTIDPPGFVWTASIHMAPFIDIVGRDKYENGKGNMVIKAASLIPMANSSGKEIDQGTMIRYMAEIMWFPHAAVSDYLDWEQIDSTHARLTMTYGDMSTSGIYTFNNDGLPIGFEAQRYRELKGKYSKETWSVITTNYGYFNETPIANKSEVTWKLKDGDFTWLRLEVTGVE